MARFRCEGQKASEPLTPARTHEQAGRRRGILGASPLFVAQARRTFQSLPKGIDHDIQRFHFQ